MTAGVQAAAVERLGHVELDVLRKPAVLAVARGEGGGGGGGGGGSGGGVGGSGSDANEVDGARVGAECSGGTGGDARTGSCVLNLGLDSYDEAARLEAEALFQERNVLPAGQSALTTTADLPTLAQRPSDPVGEHSRRNRVLYYYR